MVTVPVFQKDGNGAVDKLRVITVMIVSHLRAMISIEVMGCYYCLIQCFGSLHFATPHHASTGRAAFPLELECHVSPYLLPEKHSSQYELVEQDVIRKLLPNVTDGFYDDERQVLSYQRQIWSPQSSMYCAVAPAFTQPLTASQEYQMKCSGTRSRTRRTAKTKSQSISKFQKIAKT